MITKSLFTRILKEPLGHFLMIGFALFMIFNDGNGNHNNRITVNRDNLLTFIQYRAKEFKPKKYRQILDNFSVEQRQKVINEYVREEALYREAKALNLDQNDVTARRRLIRQLENMTRGFIDTNVKISDRDLQQFLDNNQINYAVEDKITFTHVFMKKENKAKSLLDYLNKNHVAFHQAMQFGDHFLYKRNYIRKGADEIASYFGPTMQKKLFELDPSEKIWRGPYRSDYGYHLVMVSGHWDGYIPTLSDIHERVRQDATQQHIQSKLEKAMNVIVDQYDVEILMEKE